MILGHFDIANKFNCPSPICSCGSEEETTDHYLLRCPLFRNPRVALLSTIHDLYPDATFRNIPDVDLSHILLYGDPSLNDSQNKALILATICFVNQSKRFKTLEAFINNDQENP